MEIWCVEDATYWAAAPSGTEWAEFLSAAGDMQGLKTAVHVLGDPTNDRSPAVAIVKYPSNYVLARHSHDCDRIELVIAGSVEVDGTWLGPGDMWSSPANEFYGPHTMGAGGCTTMEIGTVSGTHKLTFDIGGSSVNVDFNDPASLARVAELLQ